MQATQVLRPRVLPLCAQGNHKATAYNKGFESFWQPLEVCLGDDTDYHEGGRVTISNGIASYSSQCLNESHCFESNRV